MATKITQRISLDGAEEIKKQLNELGKEGEKAFGNLKKAIDDANKSLADAGKNVQLGLQGATQAAEQAGEAFFTSGQKAVIAGSAIITLGLVLNKLAHSYFDAAVAAAKFVNEQAAAATKAGQTTKNYAEVTGALRQTGLTAGEAEQAIKKFGAGAAKAIEDARAELKKGGITFSPGAAGDKALAEWANLGGAAKKAGSEIAATSNIARAAKGVFDPLTGAMRQDEAAWVKLADAIKSTKSPLTQITELTKVFDEQLSRRLVKALEGGGAALKKEFEDFRRLSGNLTDAQIKDREDAAAAFEKSLLRFRTATQESSTAMGIEAAKFFTPFIDGATKITVFLNELGPKIRAAVGDAFKGAFDFVFPGEEKIRSFIQLIDGLITKWRELQQIFGFGQGKPGEIDPAFKGLLEPGGEGSGIGGGPGGALDPVEQFRLSVDEIKAIAEEARAQLAQLVTTASEAIIQAFAAVGPAVQEAMAALAAGVANGAAAVGQALVAPFQAAATGIQGIVAGIGSLIDTTFASLSASIASAAAQVEQAIAAIIASLEAAVAQARALAAEAASAAASAGGGGGEGGGEEVFAFGGYTGPGGKFQPAGIVHRGEYVQPSNVVSRAGVLPFMEGLRRSGGDLRAMLERFRGFNAGGLVGSLSLAPARLPGFAGGGPVGSAGVFTSAFNLVLPDGRSFQVAAPSNTIREIERWATMSRLSSAGRLPREG